MSDIHLFAGTLARLRITLSPWSSGDWHLSCVAVDYWTDEPLANFDSRVDNLAVAQDAIDGWLTEQREKGTQSDQEASTPST